MRQRYLGFARVFLFFFVLSEVGAFANPPVIGTRETHVLEFEATQPDSDAKLSIQVSEATDFDQVANLEKLARNTAKKAAAEGAKTIILGSPSADGTGILGGEDTVEAMAVRVAEENSANSHVLINEPDEAELKELKKTKIRNYILTVVRTTGIAAGITYTVALTQNAHFLQAMWPGFAAGTMSAKLQIFNRPFQSWLSSAGFFRLNEGRPGDEHSTPLVMYGKLVLTNMIYLGTLRAAIHLTGLEHGYDFFSVVNGMNLFIASTTGSLLEYVWDRFVIESRNKKLVDDPERTHQHLRTADLQAAALSVLGTVAQALSAAGGTLGTVATGVIVATGIVRYWMFRVPDSFPAKVSRYFATRTAAIGCAVLSSILGKGP